MEIHPCSKCDKDLERRCFNNNYKGEPHTVCKICWVIHSARPDIRTCTKCFNKLELDGFSINSKGEPCKGCKKCNKKRNDLAKLPNYKETAKRANERWYEVNKDRINEQSRLNYQANNEKVACKICCSIISNNGRSKHEKTLKCQKALNIKLNTPPL
jgi:hypothetical protein